MTKHAKLLSFLKFSTVFVALAMILASTGMAWGASQVIAVNASSDDAEEDSGGDMSLGSSDLELMDGQAAVGMRFNTVNIPRDATITNAYIQFTCDETKDGDIVPSPTLAPPLSRFDRVKRSFSSPSTIESASRVTLIYCGVSFVNISVPLPR